MKLTDPWARLAAAYHLLGDRQALDKLLKHHPAAAAGVGDLYAAAQDWERAIAEYRKAITDQPCRLLVDQARHGLPVGRPHARGGPVSGEGVRRRSERHVTLPEGRRSPGVVRAGEGTRRYRAADPRVRQGHRPSRYGRPRRQGVQYPPVDRQGGTRSGARPGSHKRFELGKDSLNRPWFQLALGMAEYRSGNYAAADDALLAAAKAGPNNPHVTGTSAFYRAMSLFRQGKQDEARKLAIAAAAKMKPLPKDENNPLAGDASYDDLILWLAYKEAKAMIQFDAAPAAPAQPHTK